MHNDIREQAAKAAREWQPPHIGIDVTLLDIIRLGYQYGYMAGYEAAKAEAIKMMTPKHVRRAACPFDADDLDEERHGKL